jgi:hypothetical protein
MRRGYVVPMRWMVIYKYEVPGGALNLNSTKLPRPWSPSGSSLSRKNPHGRARNRTPDLMISSQKLWPLDHEAGPFHKLKPQDCSPYCNCFLAYHRDLIHQCTQFEPHSWNLSSIPVTGCRKQFWCFSQSLRCDVTIKHDVTTRSAIYRLDLLRTCLSDVLCSFFKF